MVSKKSESRIYITSYTFGKTKLSFETLIHGPQPLYPGLWPYKFENLDPIHTDMSLDLTVR